MFKIKIGIDVINNNFFSQMYMKNLDLLMYNLNNITY